MHILTLYKNNQLVNNLSNSNNIQKILFLSYMKELMGHIFSFFCYYNSHKFLLKYYFILFLRSIELISALMSKGIDETKVYSDSKLKLKYQILNRIGEGCFGVIYKAINRAMKRTVALKLQFHDQKQNLSAKKSSILNEIRILQKLKGVNGVPKMFAAQKWSYGYYIEIQLLSSSLYDQKNKQFTFPQICSISAELIQILKQIHSKGVVHQDLKPQNIMRNEKGSFFMIDFGLSYLATHHLLEKQSKKRGFIGTPRYASLAAHNGLIQKPKDDLESLLYVIGSVYLKKAPWFELKGPASKRLEKIQKVKQASGFMWFKQCGHPFSESYEYLMDLNPNEQINYNHLISLFQNTRKATTIKATKTEYLEISRRKSDTDNNFNLNIPTIHIHLVDKKKKESKKQIIEIKEDIEDISVSHTIFSQMAHDGYLQLIQILTQKILGTSKQIDDSALINSINCQEPQINNILKYQGLHFKNPFKI